MKLQRALKIRLDLTPAQAEVLARHGGAARFVYNWGLEQRQQTFHATNKGLTYPQQNKALTQLKAENSWLYEVSKWVGQDALRRLDAAFGNFFRDIKNRRKPPSAKAVIRSSRKKPSRTKGALRETISNETGTLTVDNFAHF